MQTVCIMMISIVKNNNNQMEYGLSCERSPECRMLANVVNNLCGSHRQSESHSVSGAEAESFES